MNCNNYLFVFSQEGFLLESLGMEKKEDIYEINFKTYELTSIQSVSREMFEKGVIYFTKPFIYLTSDSFLDFIAMPTCSSEDLYYTVDVSSNLYISNDFFLICKTIERLELSRENLLKIVHKMTPNAGCTVFSNVRRLKPYETYVFNGSDLVSKKHRFYHKNRDFSSDKNSFSYFKNALISTLRHESYGLKKVGLLFSGGVDSTLIGLILTNVLNLEVVPIFINSIPTNTDFELDKIRAKEVANILKWSLEEVFADYTSLDAVALDKFIDQIPLTPHLSLGFYEANKKFKELGCEKVFCGQNLDTLYNLESTARVGFSRGSLVALFRRFFYSNIFSDSFLDTIMAKKILKKMVQLISSIGVIFYSTIKKEKFLLPKSAFEALLNYKNSIDDVLFTPASKGIDDILASDQRLEWNSLYYFLWKHKVQEYLMGGVNMAPHSMAKINGIKMCLPYGTEMMVNFFKNNRIMLKDIFFPKRYVYDFINELSPNITKIINKKNKINKGLLGVQDWFGCLDQNTKLGKTLETDNLFELNIDKNITLAQFFNHKLSIHWITKVLNKIKKNKEKRIFNNEKNFSKIEGKALD